MLNTTTVAGRLGTAFATLLTLATLLGGIALYQMVQMNAKTEEITTSWLPSITTMAKIASTASRFRRTEMRHVLATDGQTMDQIEPELVGLKQSIAKQFEAYEPLITSADERKLIEEAQSALATYYDVHARLLPLSRGGEKTFDAARALSNVESVAAFRQFEKELQDVIDLNERGAAKAAGDAAAAYRQAKGWVAGVLVTMLLLSTAAAITIVRALQRQLGGEPGDASELARRVAEGDLTAPVRLREGDTTSLMASLARMQHSLKTVVADVRQNSENVATASAQIAQGNQDLSSRTEEQASALQQTAATMDQLGTTVRHNADNAKQANQLALGASSVAQRGGEVVGKVVSTMQGISESSRKIGDIIGVIDGIAFQTNILALNAAVEAARAGEQGRGFAVVAGEVRSLAQRSAEAAKEIKTLIGHSVDQVEQGTALVDEAGKTMDDIVGSIRRVSDIVAEITSASAEQSSGVEQVGDAVSQMDQATQQNAALVEESAAAAESLKGQAKQLVQAVAVFRL